jgi:hypothetical protein
MRTPREVLQSILNALHARAEHRIQAAKAMDAMSKEALDGEDIARPASITLTGPLVCPHCGEDLMDEREREIDEFMEWLETRPPSHEPTAPALQGRTPEQPD